MNVSKIKNLMKKLFLIILVITLGSCGKEKHVLEKNTIKNKENLENGVDVVIKTVTDSIFDKQIIANGVLEAKDKSELRFKISERIDKINVRNGQKVKKGTLLATLDNKLLLNQLEGAKINYEKAKSKLQEEKINSGYVDEKTSIINQEVLKNLEIKSGLLEAKNKLENAKILYEQSFMRSPFNGIVANLDVKAGNFVSTSDVICVILSTNSLDVSFYITESELKFFEIEKEIEFSTFDNENTFVKGKISEVNPIVDNNGLVKIKASCSSNSANLVDGMNVKIFINEKIDNCIVIPKEALVLRSNQEVVFTYVKGKSRWNYVKILHENSNSYAISEGLKLGDSVIINGNLYLSNDMKINLVSIISNH